MQTQNGRKLGFKSVCPISSLVHQRIVARKASFAVAQNRRELLCSSDSEAEGLRNGCAADADIIRKMVQDEKMNPLFLDPANFVLAEQVNTRFRFPNDRFLLIQTMQDGEVLGCGQIRSQGSEFELSSLVVKEEMRGMVNVPNSLYFLPVPRFVGRGGPCYSG
jgi:hypothetical protein